jgi:hypothetical protein
MNIKGIIIYLLMTILSLTVYSQVTDEYSVLTIRDLSMGKNETVHLKYALMQGDMLRLYLETDKSAEIGGIRISQNDKNLFNQQNINPENPIEITIPETGIVDFYFEGRRRGPDIKLRMMRLNQSPNAMFFNTAIQEYKQYDTTFIQYEIDSVIGYQEVREPIEFRIIANVDYESVEMITKKINLKGGKKNHVMLTKPAQTKSTKDKDMVLVGYQVLITSEAGAQKMWDAISTGVDIGVLALNLFLPAGGVAAGIGVDMMFSMIAPQEGGEPVYYVIMNSRENLNKFLHKDENPMVFESGLATGYSGNWAPMDTLIIGLKNLNTLAEIDISVAMFAIYQTTYWHTITQDKVVIRPEIVKVPRYQRIIRNTKTLGLQN